MENTYREREKRRHKGRCECDDKTITKYLCCD